MCGIVGYSGNNPMSQAELKSLLILANSRGGHSCGVATIEEIVKYAEEAREFCRRELPTANTVIGHTRWATRGAVSDENSHPFKYTYEDKTIIGVHNGGILNFFKLRRQEDVSHFNVDSEIIWHILLKYGLKEGFPKLRGGMALAWIDSDDQLHLYRHRNPIYVGFKNNNLYFGSQQNYLEFIKCKDIESLSTHTHYIYYKGKLLAEEDLSDYKPKTYTNNSSYYKNNYNNRSVRSAWNERQYEKSDLWVKKDGIWVMKNKQKSTEGGGVREKYKSSNTPDNAHYVHHDDEDWVVYFWFPKPAKITVQPVYPDLNYDVPITYDINNQGDMEELRKYYPEIFDNDNFKQKIGE